MAVASKFRPRPDKAVITQVVGDFRDKRVAIVLDDELSTGGTVHGLVCKLHRELGIDEVYYGVSHNRCVPEARQRLLDLHVSHGLQQVLVTDSIPQTAAFRDLSFLEVRSLADALSRTINRIHYNRSVSEVFLES
jgi:ribose-phosphate pyrophosphokinase